MKKLDTNFALLMELLDVEPQTLSQALGVDTTLISRWRTGRRRLIAGRRGVKAVAAYFLEYDNAMVMRLLKKIYPLEAAQGEDTAGLLERWLCQTDWEERHGVARREELLFVLLHPMQPSRQTPRHLPFRLTAHQLEGDAAARDALMQFLDYALVLPKPQEILFACPEGLALFTREEAYNRNVLEKLMAVLQKGFQLQVVLRTDFRISDVAAAAGPWLVAHLRGYIKSSYYDDFRLIDGEKMLLCIRETLAVQVSVGEDRTYCVISTDASDIHAMETRFTDYLAKSCQRFQYHFFTSPEDYLSDVSPVAYKPMYLFQRLPQFGVGGNALLVNLGLCVEEQTRLTKQIQPLLLAPDYFDEDVPVYHLFCAEEIDRVLDLSKHLCHALTELCGRRIYMSTQLLVNQLVEIRRLIATRANYHVLFISAAEWDRIAMEIGVWGTEAAIGWMVRKQSTACHDYINVSALHGYCASIWGRITDASQSQRSANAQVELWLKRAKKFGLQT